MKKIVSLGFPVLFMALTMLLVSCSKDDPAMQNGEENLKTGKIGDKVFSGQTDGSRFSSGGFNYLFSDGTSNYNFSGYDPTTPGGGITPPPPPPGGPGVLNFKGQSIPLLFGGSYNAGEGFFEVFFLDAVPTGANITGFSGIIFEIISPSPNFIQSGTYNYSSSELPFTFEYADIVLKIDTNDEEYYWVTNGVINFSGAGNIFDVTFSGQTNGNHQFSGSFSGTLIQFN
jgi:hypothetical protein